MINLQSFCSTDQSRNIIAKPWRANGFIFATSGTILIRVDSDVPVAGDVTDATNYHPNCDRVLVGFENIQAWNHLPDIPSCATCNDSGRAYYDCETCNGNGEHECRCGNTHDCEDCGGKGKIERTCRDCGAIFLGPRKVAKNLARLVATLPNPLYGLDNDEKEKPIHFKFDGGIGMVMPLRQTECV